MGPESRPAPNLQSPAKELDADPQTEQHVPNKRSDGQIRERQSDSNGLVRSIVDPYSD